MPRSCTSAYGPEDKQSLQSQPQASQQLILHKLGLFLTCHMVPHTLWRNASPESVPTTTWLCEHCTWTGAPWRAHHTSPTKQRGKTIPSPYPWAFMYCASSHWSQRRPCTGDRACTAQMWSVFPVIPLLLKIVDITAPNEMQGNAD